MQIGSADPDGAETAAQRIADRGGAGASEYAEAVYPELKEIWAEMGEREAAPVLAYVPPVPISTRPLVPAVAYVQARRCTEEERTLDAVVDMASHPVPHRHGEPEITRLELPAGLACRVHEVLLSEADEDGRSFLSERVDHYVLPPQCPEGMFKLSVQWAGPTISVAMVEIADRMGVSLGVWAEGEGE
ncbi:hypothetical protein [Streptomyces sp. NBRC 109706]|uniref:hypothetical protein n=1 Tax=Streptomyces sp. NBRC 109706 TaxID=1550035 RepID=UPI0007853BA6|nr:hypothetical protein [Streptomyces sp. NBRC 109706]